MRTKSAEIRPTVRVAGAYQWRIRPDWEPDLLGPQGLRLSEWMENGAAQIVKSGPHRVVYRVDLPCRSFFVKHYRCQHILSAGRHLLQATASRREWAKSIAVSRREIPTVTPVALGEHTQHGLVHDSYLITEAIPNAISLDEYMRRIAPQLSADDNRLMRSRLARSAARMCAAAHRAGVDHNDFHTGNILIAADSVVAADGLPRLYLIDLPGIRLSGPLNWPRSRDSLVMLGSDWLARTSRAERWRFWKEYLRNRPDLKLDRPSIEAQRLLGRMRAYSAKIARGRDKRSLHDNRDFFQMRDGHGHGHAVVDVAPDALRQLLADPERLMRDHDQQPIKLSHTSVVYKSEAVFDATRLQVAYKRARVKYWWKAVLAPVRSSRAKRGWYLGHALLQRGIATPRPIATWETRQHGLRWDSHLATQWIEGATNLHLYLWDIAKLPARHRQIRSRQLADSLGQLIGRMHSWNVSHRDLKPCNLVAVEHADTIETLVIDLDGIRLQRRISAKKRAANLARLAAGLSMHPWISHTARLRFLKAYLKQQPSGTQNWKKTWKDTAASATCVVARLKRRGLVA